MAQGQTLLAANKSSSSTAAPADLQSQQFQALPPASRDLPPSAPISHHQQQLQQPPQLQRLQQPSLRALANIEKATPPEAVNVRSLASGTAVHTDVVSPAGAHAEAVDDHVGQDTPLTPWPAVHLSPAVDDDPADVPSPISAQPEAASANVHNSSKPGLVDLDPATAAGTTAESEDAASCLAVGFADEAADGSAGPKTGRTGELMPAVPTPAQQPEQVPRPTPESALGGQTRRDAARDMFPTDLPTSPARHTAFRGASAAAIADMAVVDTLGSSVCSQRHNENEKSLGSTHEESTNSRSRARASKRLLLPAEGLQPALNGCVADASLLQRNATATGYFPDADGSAPFAASCATPARSDCDGKEAQQTASAAAAVAVQSVDVKSDSQTTEGLHRQTAEPIDTSPILAEDKLQRRQQRRRQPPRRLNIGSFDQRNHSAALSALTGQGPGLSSARIERDGSNLNSPTSTPQSKTSTAVTASPESPVVLADGNGSPSERPSGKVQFGERQLHTRACDGVRKAGQRVRFAPQVRVVSLPQKRRHQL